MEASAATAASAPRNSHNRVTGSSQNTIKNVGYLRVGMELESSDIDSYHRSRW